MKISSFILSCLVSAFITHPALAQEEPVTMQQSLNMIAYEHKTPNQYAVVSYMPYYPAYGMVSLKSPQCNAEIAGYIDPFAIKHKKLTITYKTCKVSFDISQDDQTLSNPIETQACQEYHPKNCNFSQIATLNHIALTQNP